MGTSQIILIAAVAVLYIIAVVFDVKIQNLASMQRRNARLFETFAEILQLNSNKITEEEKRLSEVSDNIDKIQHIMNELLSSLILAEKRTDAMINNLYPDIYDKTEKDTEVYQSSEDSNIYDSIITSVEDAETKYITRNVSDEFVNILNNNKRDSIKAKIQMLCDGGEQYSRYIGDDLVGLLRELSEYEDTTELIDSNPKIMNMLFQTQ